MSVLADHQIRHLAFTQNMITPCANEIYQPGKLSSGLSSYGYDITLGQEFRTINPSSFSGEYVLDPKNPAPDLLCERYIAPGYPLILPPHGFALGVSVETFKIPRDLLVLCLGKSTYARSGLNVNITPMEPEWEGQLTIELFNATPYRLYVYPGEGIAQIIFLKADEICQRSYADKKGKYQNQFGPTLPRG